MLFILELLVAQCWELKATARTGHLNVAAKDKSTILSQVPLMIHTFLGSPQRRMYNTQPVVTSCAFQFLEPIQSE